MVAHPDWKQVFPSDWLWFCSSNLILFYLLIVAWVNAKTIFSQVPVSQQVTFKFIFLQVFSQTSPTHVAISLLTNHMRVSWQTDPLQTKILWSVLTKILCLKKFSKLSHLNINRETFQLWEFSILMNRCKRSFTTVERNISMNKCFSDFFNSLETDEFWIPNSCLL